MEEHSEELFGYRSGKVTGRFIAAIFFMSFYFIVKATLGNKENFDKTIAEFEFFDPAEQKRMSRNGLVCFVSSIGLFVVSLIVYLIVS